MLALKAIKSTKLLLAVISLAAYSVALGWQVAVVFVFGLCCHEYGHVWAMRRCGIPTRGFYLVPFVGGLCSPGRPFEQRLEEAYVALAGPVLGLACLPVAYALALPLTGSPERAAAAVAFLAFLNLFNLLPIVPMDGGRVMRACVSSVSRRAGVALALSGGALAAYIAWSRGIPLLFFVAALAILEGVSEARGRRDIRSLSPARAAGWFLLYFLVLAVAAGALALADALAGHTGLLHALRHA